MKEWDKKTIENYLGVPNGDIQPCDQFTPEIYDDYQLGLLSETEIEAIERHTAECPDCRAYLAMIDRIWRASSADADAISKKRLMQKLENHISKTSHDSPADLRWAAATEKKGTAGKAYGVAVAEKGKSGRIIECEAFVEVKEKPKGLLKILGLSGDRGVLRHLEEKMTHFIFPSCDDLKAYNLDRRFISVDLDENLFSTAESLSLAIIMAIINGIESRVENPPCLYTAKVEAYGALKEVSRLAEKVEVAIDNGFKTFVLSKENENDLPPHYLKHPELQFLFFETLHELLAYHNIGLPDATSARMQARLLNAAQEKTDLHERAVLKSSTIADGNLTPILEELRIKPSHQDLWRRLLIFAEDLSHTGDLHDELSTAFVIGPDAHIDQSLPETVMTFRENPNFFDMAGIIEDLSELVDGQQLCFTLDQAGTITSVRYINPSASHISEANELLTKGDRTMAALSNHQQAHVIFFPPFQHQIKLFSNGALIARYTNGQWRLVDYKALNIRLKSIVQDDEINWPVLKATIQAAVSMAENGQGGTFAFIPEHGDAKPSWKDRLRIDFGLELVDSSLLELDTKLLSTLARMKGAVVIDSRGKLLAARAYFAEQSLSLRIMKASARHRTAQQFSANTGALCVVASRYGTITIYHRGIEMVRI